MRKLKPMLPVVVCLLLAIACQPTVETQVTNTDSLVVVAAHEATTAEYVTANLNDSSAYLLADTITYSVLIRNTNPDDEWTTKCISRLDKKTLIDVLFKAIYDGRLKAYDYYTGEEMTIEQVKKMEKTPEYKRELAGKIQFEEAWYFDNESLQMSKIVQYVMIAYERYAENGQLSGHRAGIRIALNMPRAAL